MLMDAYIVRAQTHIYIIYIFDALPLCSVIVTLDKLYNVSKTKKKSFNSHMKRSRSMCCKVCDIYVCVSVLLKNSFCLTNYDTMCAITHCITLLMKMSHMEKETKKLGNVFFCGIHSQKKKTNKKVLMNTVKNVIDFKRTVEKTHTHSNQPMIMNSLW